MLPDILLDPSILWLVESDDTAETASDAIVGAMEWMKPKATGPLHLMVSSRSVDALATANAFPAEPRLAEMLKSIGLEGVISPKNLATSVARFLSSNNWIEHRLGLRDILFQSVTITPDPTSAISDATLRAGSTEAMGLASVCAHGNPLNSLYAFSRQDDPKKEVRVQTAIDIVEFGADDVRTEQNTDNQISILRHPSAWSTALSPDEIWRLAETEEEIEVAIFLTAKSLAEQASCGIREFRVGTNFLDCLASNGASADGPYASLVLQKCAQTVLEQSSLQPNPFLTSASSTSPQRERTRDGAKAWRLHVTKSHQALRLMYWVLPCGQIEFATLEEKSEESIHEGEAICQRNW